MGNPKLCATLLAIMLLSGMLNLGVPSGAQQVYSGSPAILVGFCSGAAPTAPGVTSYFGLGQFLNNNCEGAGPLGPPSGGVPMPSSGTLMNLQAAGGAAAGDMVTVYVNGAATPVSCTLDMSLSCSNTIDTLPVNAGDLVGVAYTKTTTRAAGAVSLEKGP